MQDKPLQCYIFPNYRGRKYLTLNLSFLCELPFICRDEDLQVHRAVLVLPWASQLTIALGQGYDLARGHEDRIVWAMSLSCSQWLAFCLFLLNGAKVRRSVSSLNWRNTLKPDVYHQLMLHATTSSSKLKLDGAQMLLGSSLAVILSAAMLADEISVWTRRKVHATHDLLLGENNLRQFLQSWHWERCGTELQLLCYCTCCFDNPHFSPFVSLMGKSNKNEDETSFLIIELMGWTELVSMRWGMVGLDWLQF